MGFGHRVYKNYDPRASVMRKSCHEVLGELGVEDDPLLALAMELERIALEDEYFAEKKLFPNVDFYSGIILKAMGFPTSMFTVLFAVARTVGWVAQWKEMIEDPRLPSTVASPRHFQTVRTAAQAGHLDLEDIARPDRLAEARLLDRHEIDQLAGGVGPRVSTTITPRSGPWPR